jgi:transcriptional regulator with XRE-family HTH domain
VIIVSRLSETLVYLRKRDDLTQKALSEKINVSRSLIAMYEKDPSLENLEAIADAFNVSIDFLVGHVDSGEHSKIFTSNLKRIIDSSDKHDLEAAGIDLYEVDLIIKRVIPLTFDYACELSDQLGESIDSMLGIEKSGIAEDAGLSEITKIFTLLDPDSRTKLLELGHLYANAPRKNEGT